MFVCFFIFFRFLLLFCISFADYDERVLPSIVNEVTKAVVAKYNASELLTKREVWSVPHLSCWDMICLFKDYGTVGYFALGFAVSCRGMSTYFGVLSARFC